MKKLVIGIASQQAIRARALAIARGDHQPRPSEPKIWFTSMRSLAEVLSDDNRALLRVIREQKPESLSQLAEFTGRALKNRFVAEWHGREAALADPAVNRVENERYWAAAACPEALSQA